MLAGNALFPFGHWSEPQSILGTREFRSMRGSCALTLLLNSHVIGGRVATSRPASAPEANDDPRQTSK